MFMELQLVYSQKYQTNSVQLQEVVHLVLLEVLPLMVNIVTEQILKVILRLMLTYHHTTL